MVGPEPKQRNGTGGGGALQLRAWPSCLSTWKRLRLLDLQRATPAGYHPAYREGISNYHEVSI